MAKQFGGKYSPNATGNQTTHKRQRRAEVDPAGGRANLLFVPAIVLVATSFSGGAVALFAALLGAASLTLSAWLLRGGLRAEAAYHARKVARRPALPRKVLAAVFSGIGAALAVMAHSDSFTVIAPVLYGIIAAGLHLTAFGLDPMRNKGMDGVDTFQQDRVARVVDEAEKHLASMRETILRAGDRQGRFHRHRARPDPHGRGRSPRPDRHAQVFGRLPARRA